jgi:catechol 2,3-dioxygenase-like lactoylglutathione lyase family enzyme
MMALAPRISLITLGVADLPRARAFYATLGWHEAAESSEAIAFFQLHGQVLALYPRAQLGAEMGRTAPPEGSGAVTLAQNLGSAAAVDALYGEMVAAGAVSLRAPSPTHYGGYVAYVADPDGHVWELAHVDAFPLADDGTLTLPSVTA